MQHCTYTKLNKLHKKKICLLFFFPTLNVSLLQLKDSPVFPLSLHIISRVEVFYVFPFLIVLVQMCCAICILCFIVNNVSQ